MTPAEAVQFLADQYAIVQWFQVQDWRDWPPSRDRDIHCELPADVYTDTRLVVVTLTQHPVRVVAPDLVAAVEACVVALGDH